MTSAIQDLVDALGVRGGAPFTLKAYFDQHVDIHGELGAALAGRHGR